MHPILLKIGVIEVQSFWVMITLGAIIACFLGCRYILYLRRTQPESVWYDSPVPQQLIKLVILFYIFGIIGARFNYIIWRIDKYIQDPFLIFKIQRGGLNSFGMLFAIAIVCFIYTKKNKLNTLKTFDIVFAYVPIVDLFRRIGCFLNGCCFGKFTNSSFGACLPLETIARGECIRRHPVPLYFVGLFIIIFIVLKIIRSRPYKPGAIVFTYFLVYSFGRFFIEFFRIERVISDKLPLKAPQLICIGIFVMSIIVLYLLYKKRRVSEQ